MHQQLQCLGEERGRYVKRRQPSVRPAGGRCRCARVINYAILQYHSLAGVRFLREAACSWHGRATLPYILILPVWQLDYGRTLHHRVGGYACGVFGAQETRVERRATSAMHIHTHLFYCPGARGEENKCLLNVNIKHHERRVPVSHLVGCVSTPYAFIFTLAWWTEFFLLGLKCEFTFTQAWNRERMYVIKFTPNFIVSNARLDSSYFQFSLFSLPLSIPACVWVYYWIYDTLGPGSDLCER